MKRKFRINGIWIVISLFLIALGLFGVAASLPDHESFIIAVIAFVATITAIIALLLHAKMWEDIT